MQKQSNADLIRFVYEAFGRGDAPAVLGTFDPGIVWHEAENFTYADRNPYRGPQQVAEGVFMRILSDFEGFTVTPERIVDGGDEVVALGRYRGVCKATGQSIDAQFVHAWSIRDGRVTAFQQYTDTLQFARASGAIARV